LGTPGAHGAGVAGTQGIGVSTPSAAAVAAATVGFAGDEHMPNDMMLTNGTLSVITPSIKELLWCGRGVGTKVDGAAPKGVHCVTAVPATC
jgi:hypothetical protein